jgi:coenzyme F420 hydrogenase subunit beta
VESAGSRYAPVGAAALSEDLEAGDVFVGKPCEVSFVRAAAAVRGRESDLPLLLSFFCAGTPSLHATSRVLDRIGVAPEVVASVDYRGDGWPGDFVARDESGSVLGRCTYQESWGEVLGRDLPWRCKLCGDAVGENADIVVCDYWRSDEHGYPVFEDADGVSAVIARTRRGEDTLRAAADEGVVSLAKGQMQSIRPIQPTQVRRKDDFWWRIAARRLTGHAVPMFFGVAVPRSSLLPTVGHMRALVGSMRRSIRGTSK